MPRRRPPISTDDTTGASIAGAESCPLRILRNLRDLPHDDGFRVDFVTLADVADRVVSL